jgi:GNAT superfamily N-acetyltransferase
MAHDSEGFWEMMGRFFADRHIRKELGMAMSSDERYTWFVAVNGATVLGFCAAVFTPAGVEFKHRWVLPSHRGQGIGYALFEARLEFARDRPIKAVAVPSVQALFERHGFVKVRQQGRYPVMKRGWP